jgi:Nucleotidyl transferase AbiEii toxin, Type IV TA system
MVTGDFEIHLTGSGQQATELAAFAERHDVKFVHIELDRGETPSQPMLTITGSGTSAQLRELAERWRADMWAAGLRVLRVKIEAAPWNEGVPLTDDDARADLYFEHHVKVVLPAGDDGALDVLASTVRLHNARPSRNARRTRADGRQERFVTQRCHGVGRPVARGRLDVLLAALAERGFETLEIEEEYVVEDDAPQVDRGWLEQKLPWTDERRWTPPVGAEGFPSTYQPLAVWSGRDVRQRALFDPALKQFGNAYRASEPRFADAAVGRRWLAVRRAAMAHVLATVAASSWATNLVLRGSVVLPAWLGEAAREPGDLDFVVAPHTLGPDGDEAKAMLDGLVAAIAADPGPTLRPDRVVSERIWTYERVPGRRLVIPFEPDGLPQGTVQLDVVFNEPLPEAPIMVRLPMLDAPVLAATPGLSVAWKLQWLMTDSYPQGKDLYDAVLLAERTTVPMDLVRELLRPELGALADDFDAEDVMSLDVDWHSFQEEYPDVGGDRRSWLHRLAVALGLTDPSGSNGGPQPQ